jgi:hypothetical protein
LQCIEVSSDAKPEAINCGQPSSYLYNRQLWEVSILCVGEGCAQLSPPPSQPSPPLPPTPPNLSNNLIGKAAQVQRAASTSAGRDCLHAPFSESELVDTNLCEAGRGSHGNDGFDTQLWIIVDAGDGNVCLRNQYSDRYGLSKSTNV